MKRWWIWAMSGLGAMGGVTLLILKPVWFVLLIGAGIILFLAFLLLVDYIGALLCKRR